MSFEIEKIANAIGGQGTGFEIERIAENVIASGDDEGSNGGILIVNFADGTAQDTITCDVSRDDIIASLEAGKVVMGVYIVRAGDMLLATDASIILFRTGTLSTKLSSETYTNAAINNDAYTWNKYGS